MADFSLAGKYTKNLLGKINEVNATRGRGFAGKPAVGQVEAAKSGGTSLASGQNQQIMNGEVNKFANPNDTALAGDMVAQANGKPSLGAPVPQKQPEDMVSQALGAPNTAASAVGVEKVLDPNRIGASELTSGQGTVDIGGRRTYEVNNGVVTKFDAQGNAVPVKQIGSYQSAPATPASSTLAEQPAAAQQGFAFQRQSGPSDYALRLAARNAAVGGSDMRAKAEYKQLLASKVAADQYNKDMTGVQAGLAAKGIEAEAHKYAADQSKLGELAKSQAAGAKVAYDATKDKAELLLKGEELKQKEKSQLGQQNIDLGKLNEMYDVSISKAAVEGTPESVQGLHQGRAASLLTATGGDVQKAIKSDPKAMEILSGKLPPQQKLEQLKALHPAYANYLLKNQG